MTAKILIVDDEEQLRQSLQRLFKMEGYEARTADSGEGGLDAAREWSPNVILSDLKMPGINGLDFLKAAKAINIDAEIILMTAYGTIEAAVSAMKEGAYDFIQKPYKKADVLRIVGRAVEKQSLLAENKRLKMEIERLSRAEGHAILGQSQSVRACLETVRQAAPSSATILLLGESGTGKELFAKEIHRLSARADGPFIAVNCAALPETILESELFGYEKGAFTGAASQRKGRFEAADGGTIFLDEIGDMSASLQAKLLRVLESGSFERLGSNAQIRVDARIVAATNKDMRRMVEEGSFREDLYYRLNVIVINIPPLRERLEDVPLLAAAFVKKYSETHGKGALSLSPEAAALLKAQTWRGNVRELEKTIERAVVLTRRDVITPSDFPDLKQESGKAAAADKIEIPFGTPMEEVERIVINETLRRADNDKKLAANILGISDRTIYRKLGDDRSGEEQ